MLSRGWTGINYYLNKGILASRFGLTKLNFGITKNEKRLIALKNSYKDSRCFVIGNGPSLCEMDLTKLKGEITIGSNGLFLLFDDIDFFPTFFTIEDVLVAEDRAIVVNSLKGMKKIFPIDLTRWLKQDEDTIYINFIRQYPGFPCFSKYFEHKVYWGGTVTFLNLQLAYYLGIREVYLIGLDHTYQPPTPSDVVDGTVIYSNSKDINHFHPDYFGPGYRWHDPKVDRMEMAYHVAKIFFETNGRRIYNATSKGNLEVFPRVKFSTLFH